MPLASESAQRRAGAPFFTIVVPAFNAASTLVSCMNSVLTQTVADLELVVVDDGSTDDTGQIADAVKDPRVRVIHQSNRGLPGARNAGILAARGEVTSFLDSDDLLLPTYVETVRRGFVADPGVDFVYTDTWTFNDHTRRVRKKTTGYYWNPPEPPPATADEFFRELVKINFLTVPVAVRTKVIIAAGMFDETMTAGEDWEMWLRLSATGHRAAEARGPLGLRRQHVAQMSRDPLRMVDNRIAIFQKILAEYPLSAENRERVVEALERGRRERAIISGSDRLRSLLRRGRHQLGRLRRRLGLDEGWYTTPPPAVAAAFGDLSDV